MNRSIAIHPSEARAIAVATLASPEHETGGDLFGTYSRSRSAIVQYVLPAGPGARRSFGSFFQDADFLERGARELGSRFYLNHVGSWHSHHRLKLADPSVEDERTVHRAMECAGLESFLLVITTLVPREAGRQQASRGDARGAGELGRDEHRSNGAGALVPRLRAFHYTPEELHPEPATWIFLDEETSPVRAALEEEPLEAESMRGVEYELHPARCSVAELRGSRTSVVEETGQRWYTRPEGERVLEREVQELTQAGARPRILLDEHDELMVEACVGEQRVRFLLSSSFPVSAPGLRIEDRGGVFRPLDWADVCGAYHRWQGLVTCFRALERFAAGLQERSGAPEAHVIGGAGSAGSAGALGPTTAGTGAARKEDT